MVGRYEGKLLCLVKGDQWNYVCVEYYNDSLLQFIYTFVLVDDNIDSLLGFICEHA